MKKPLAAALCNLGVSADALTALGVLLAALAGWLIASGALLGGAFALIGSGLVDLLDGEVARVSGKQSPFGGILDSSLDRYGDAFMFGGLTLYFGGQGRADLAVVAMSAWAAAFLVSYVRARAECEDRVCRVGFWERGERIGVLAAGLILDNAAAAAWLLGTLVHWTVLQRLVCAYRKSDLKPPSRADFAYKVKIGLILAYLVFVRVP